jgi:hypothetical protein
MMGNMRAISGKEIFLSRIQETMVTWVPRLSIHSNQMITASTTFAATFGNGAKTLGATQIQMRAE